MAGIAAGDRQTPMKISGRHRAAGIYGAIITPAIIASSGGKLSTIALVDRKSVV